MLNIRNSFNREDFYTLNNFDISNAISPAKADEEISRISFIRGLQQRVIELEQSVEDKSKIIEQQKLSIINLKNQMSK